MTAKNTTETKKHALLSASASHRWLHCTPSARLEETFPESTSEYAEEGRLAHEIAELKLRKHFTEPMGSRTFNNRLKKFQESPLFQPEMLTHTDTYLNYVSETVHGFSHRPSVVIEMRVDYSEFAPEGFGTADCIIIEGQKLIVIDLKYGKGVPVSANRNPQMMLYALGAYRNYSLLWDIQTVKMAIVQPRLDTISEFEMPVADLLDWGNTVVKDAAQKAYKGEGEYVSGDHCQFCRAKALCRARADFNTSLESQKGLLPPLIGNDEVGDLLTRAQDLVKWANALEEYALAELLRGGDIPGWKAVEGRSTRKFTDQDAAFGVLRGIGIDEAMLYERKPLTLTGVESLVGKAKFTEILGGYVVTPPGKPTIAPLSDKREAIKRVSAEDDFGNSVNNEVVNA